MPKKKSRNFTFEIPEDFVTLFEGFQAKAGNDDRSTASAIRLLIKKDMEEGVAS